MAKTTMRLERTVEGDLLFSGAISATDFARLRLDNFDRALLADCEGQGRTAADWLLALETVFRRMQEQGIAGVEIDAELGRIRATKECGTCKYKAHPLGYGPCRACRYSGYPNWEPEAPVAGVKVPQEGQP